MFNLPVQSLSYTITETPPSGEGMNGKGQPALKGDELYDKSQSEAAKNYLRMVGHSISFEELVDALIQGGARLGGVDGKKTLYVSLARNPKKELLWRGKGADQPAES